MREQEPKKEFDLDADRIPNTEKGFGPTRRREYVVYERRPVPGVEGQTWLHEVYRGVHKNGEEALEAARKKLEEKSKEK